MIVVVAKTIMMIVMVIMHPSVYPRCACVLYVCVTRCGINVSVLMRNDALKAFFPFHEEAVRDALFVKWVKRSLHPIDQPLDDIKVGLVVDRHGCVHAIMTLSLGGLMASVSNHTQKGSLVTEIQRE